MPMFQDPPLILIVDDTPINIRLLAESLRQEYRVKVSTSGSEALEIVSAPESFPDLILLDVMMPGMDGFETCRRLRADEKTKDIPVIFMTALDSVEDKVAGFQAGGLDYITKPFQQAEVLARVETHITLRRKSIALEQALAENKTLKGFIPICCRCKQIRNDAGFWQQVDEYISEHSDATFSHGLCPACFEKEMHEIDHQIK